MPADGLGETDCWLVDSPFTGLKRGRRVDEALLATLVRDAGRYAQGEAEVLHE